MSALLLPALAAGSSGQSALYVDDVFSAYLYTGNGSTQTINNGIDLAGKGGLVWIKSRDEVTNNSLFTNSPAAGSFLMSDTTGAMSTSASFGGFYSAGFSLIAGQNNVNSDLNKFVSWTFRRAPKFFDVVTYTGNGVAGRQIAHGLGVQAGFVTVKATSTTGDWNSYHRSATGDLKLNLTDAQTASREIITAADASTFTVSGAANTNGVSYVAYLWAHDPSADGIVQCGSYTGNGSATGPVVTLGWEPQYLMIKNASGTGNWQIIDSMRGMPVEYADAALQASLSNAESATDYVSPTATGFQVISTSSEVNTNGATYIYLAIRRPNKPPTSGTQVFEAIARTGTSTVTTAGTLNAVDLSITNIRITDTAGRVWYDRLRGSAILRSNLTTAEAANQTISFDTSVGIKLGSDGGGATVNQNGAPYSQLLFRRAPGFFDVVAYTGTGVARTVNHNLGVAPELMIVKKRTGGTARNWAVFSSSLGELKLLMLNQNYAALDTTTTWSQMPGNSVFYVGTDAESNENSYPFIAYLFASLPGISKVGSYTGNGSNQTINCGFSAGARFILIKRTDSTGDWYVWDSARGIVAANDPHLSLNTTAAEVITDDSIDPASVGFIVNQNAATNVNVTGANYIFLAIA